MSLYRRKAILAMERIFITSMVGLSCETKLNSSDMNAEFRIRTDLSEASRILIECVQVDTKLMFPLAVV